MIRKPGIAVLAGCLMLLFLLSSGGQAAAQKLEKMRVGYNAITGSNSALWISKEAGLTAKNGLDVEFIYIESGSRLTPAMVWWGFRGPPIRARVEGFGKLFDTL